MNQFLEMNVFFFITSVITIVFGILVSILLFYVIKTAKNLHILSEKLNDTFDNSEEFITDLKERLESNMIFRIFFPQARKRRHSSSKGASIE